MPKDYIYGLTITSSDEATVTVNGETPSGRQNLLLHGLGSLLQHIIVTRFYKNGGALHQLRVAPAVGNVLCPGDAVLNLNYGTLFELALQQAGVPFLYAANTVGSNGGLVCKPHGSLNLAADERKGWFAFGQPDWLGTPAPAGTISFSGLLPPRYNKRYEQVPIAKMILAPLLNLRPRTASFWGVGFTSSDADLLDMYRQLARSATRVEVINPDDAIALTAEDLLYKNVHHYRDVQSWLAAVDA